MNKWSELLTGLILVIIGVVVWYLTLGLSANGISWDFGTAAWEFLKGGLLWMVLMLGFLFILLGISDLRN
jgi:hypothetical protein